jgi:hypothetical protein
MVMTLTDYADKSALIGSAKDGTNASSHEAKAQIQRQRLKVKIEMAKERMGAKLCCHSDYRLMARHSVHKAIYEPARQEYLSGIKAAAAADREKNPAFSNRGQ